jgi:hypothetical protein
MVHRRVKVLLRGGRSRDIHPLQFFYPCGRRRSMYCVKVEVGRLSIHIRNRAVFAYGRERHLHHQRLCFGWNPNTATIPRPSIACVFSGVVPGVLKRDTQPAEARGRTSCAVLLNSLREADREVESCQLLSSASFPRAFRPATPPPPPKHMSTLPHRILHTLHLSLFRGKR